MSEAKQFSSVMNQWGSSIFAPRASSKKATKVEPLYIMAIKMSSPNQTLSTKWLDDAKMFAEVEYKLSHEARQAISRVRARYGVPAHDESANFMNTGVYIVKKSQIQTDPKFYNDDKKLMLHERTGDPKLDVAFDPSVLIGGVADDGKPVPGKYPEMWGMRERIDVGARLCMRDIHPSLSATVYFLPLDGEQARHTELYDRVVASVRAQIYGDLLKRLQAVIAQNRDKMRTQSKQSLLNQIEHFREKANILNDEEIDKELDRFKAIIEAEIIEPLALELDNQMDSLSDRYGFIRGEAE